MTCICAIVLHGTQLLQSCSTLCNAMDYSPPALLSMGFSRQEHCCGLSCPPPGDLPDPGIVSPVSCTAGGFFTIEPPRKL